MIIAFRADHFWETTYEPNRANRLNFFPSWIWNPGFWITRTFSIVNINGVICGAMSGTTAQRSRGTQRFHTGWRGLEACGCDWVTISHELKPREMSKVCVLAHCTPSDIIRRLAATVHNVSLFFKESWSLPYGIWWSEYSGTALSTGLTGNLTRSCTRYLWVIWSVSTTNCLSTSMALAQGWPDRYVLSFLLNKYINKKSQRYF